VSGRRGTTVSVTYGTSLLPCLINRSGRAVRRHVVIPQTLGGEGAARQPLEGWAESEQRFVPSKEALDEGLALAPGWSRDLLRKFVKWASELTEPLRLPVDRAFVCWVPSFTKGSGPRAI
jgi:hypothetical protein